jgi:DNA-binding CsgD family transcriptional regulator/tetratricopeptide (TPR) repeat protein/type II secretory pathway predicted ATPase ExeA
MAGMGRRTRSPRLVGRDADLAVLLDAIAAVDSDRPVVLITGEAGIGKTRLLSELADRLTSQSDDTTRPSISVVRGSCLRLADGELRFAQIIEILDGLRVRGTDAAIDGLRDRLTGAGPDGPASTAARTLRFIEINDALAAAAGDRPMAILIDDLHWADQSTLDLLLFLARRLRGSRLVLVLAYRSDELHRRHPLRPVIAELARGYARESIELGPLAREAVSLQIEELGGSADPEIVHAIVDRADGNPFYVEELVALEPGARGLPASVRDVLLARLAALDATTSRVLAACAVVGHEIDDVLLKDLLQLDDQTLAAALHEAVDHSILVAGSDGGTYRFRHALLEEAVHDDLLPADRVELHRRIAVVLERRLADGHSVSPGEMARHLDRGGRREAAISAYVEAAALAFRALSWAEGVAAFERATELVAAEPADSQLDARLRDLVIPAAVAMNWSGASTKGIALLRDWIERTERASDPAAAVPLWMALSRILNDVGQEPGSREAVRIAAGLQPPDSSTETGVDLLVALGSEAWIQGHARKALQLAREALAGAERLSDPALLFRALVHRAEAAITLGDIAGGLADVERARALQRQHGWLDTYGYLGTNIGIALADAGEIGRALDVWQESLRMSKDLGITLSWDPWNLPGLALHAFTTGRWSEADDPLAQAQAFGAQGMPTAFNEWVTALLAAGRGDLATCDQAIRKAEQHAVDAGGDWFGLMGLAKAARASAAGDPGRALEELEAGQRALSGLDSFVVRSRLAAETASAAADLVATLHPRRDAARIEDARTRARIAAETAADLAAGRVIPGTRSGPWTSVNALLAEADAMRAAGTDDPSAWPPIVDAFRALEMTPRVAYALLREATAALRAGRRDLAESALQEANQLATSIGMTVLLRDITAAARAGRVDLRARDRADTADAQARPAASSRSAPDRWGLSARERDVLALIAEGRTNGEIGARLYISTKTASVHVTHILDKLGVSSRTEAALLAHQPEVVD